MPDPQISSPMLNGSMPLTEPKLPEVPEWLQELFPFSTRILRVGAYGMSFVDAGPAQTAAAAPVAVLLHGNPTWSFLYRDLIQRLRSKYRVVAPDMVGFGLSDKPDFPAYHSLEQHVSNLTRLIETLELRNLVLVMNGWGGPVGLAYAVAHPENVHRLVLTNTWGANLPARKPRFQPLGIRVACSGRLGRALDSWLNLAMHSTFSSRMYRTIGDLALEAYSYPFRQGTSRSAISSFSQMFFNPDLATIAKLDQIQKDLAKIAAPADILCGAQDPVLGKLPAYLLRDDLKHAAEPVFLPEISHYLPEEAPNVLAETVLRGMEPKSAPRTGRNLFKILS
jgi:haloalkane dehalogenase